MTDNIWIRTFGGKKVYCDNVIRADGGFEGYLRGTADNANGLQGKDVNHFYRHLGGRETPTLVPLVDWERMKQENGGRDVRNINNPAAHCRIWWRHIIWPKVFKRYNPFETELQEL